MLARSAGIRGFPMPRPYRVAFEGVHPACGICGDVARFIVDRGPHLALICSSDHLDGDWIGSEHFQEGGKYYGLLPPEDFDQKRRRRSKRFQLREHVRVALLQETQCFFCATELFNENKTARNVRSWLESQRPPLWGRVINHFRAPRHEFSAVPFDWPSRIPNELHDVIEQELAFSKIEADHLIPVKYLELIGDSVSTRFLDFGGRDLGIPLCQKCNRGRTLAGLESAETLFERWTAYNFDGNRRAAMADQRWKMLEALVQAACRIDADLRGLNRARENP
jgi:hypothetical protein